MSRSMIRCVCLATLASFFSTPVAAFNEGLVAMWYNYDFGGDSATSPAMSSGECGMTCETLRSFKAD